MVETVPLKLNNNKKKYKVKPLPIPNEPEGDWYTLKQSPIHFFGGVRYVYLYKPYKHQ